MNDRDIDGAVRRTVGLAVLRRLRRLVDAEAAHERSQAAWAIRLSWAFALAAALTLAWLAFR